MDSDEIQFFKEEVRLALRKIFFNKRPDSATDYFAVWQLCRKVLEEELEKIIGPELQGEVRAIKNG